MNTQEQSRPRPDPLDRFAAPEHFIELEKVKTSLLKEPLAGEHGHRHATIYKTHTLTIATFVFEKGGALRDHVTKGVVVIQVITGKLAIKTVSQAVEIIPGQVLILAPNVHHSVTAREPSQMLLTVDLAG